MSGHRKWSEVRESRQQAGRAAAVSEEARAAVKKRLLDHVKTLAELRRARLLTQRQLARLMQVSQAQVSRVENQTDLYLSTLRTYVEAMGGELQIRVAFPGSGWTEVSVGDVTGGRPAEEPADSATAGFNVPAFELMVQSYAGVRRLPPAQQVSAICFNTSRSVDAWTSYAANLRSFVTRHRSLLVSGSDLGAVLYEPEEREGVEARRFVWRTARDPYIPEDSERFVSSAHVKEL